MNNISALRLLYLLIVSFCLHAHGAYAEHDTGHESTEIATDISIDTVNIAINFEGSSVIMYGVKNPHSDVIITLQGPDRNVQVKKKENTLLGWRFNKGVSFKNVPSFYAVSSSADVDQLLSEAEQEKYRVGKSHIIPINDGDNKKTQEEFAKALIKSKEDNGLFISAPAPINLINEQFFKVEFSLPRNVPQGKYSLQVLSVLNGTVQNMGFHEIGIAQVGFNAAVFKWSKNSPLSYGIMCALVSILFGLFSNRLKRLI